MNPWQMAQQIKHKLRTVTWPSGSGEVVFGAQHDSVVVFAGTPNEENIPPGFPWALVIVDTGDPDEDHPGFLLQNFRVIAGAEVAGDPYGEFAIIGGAVADLGDSAGRGIAEVDERVRSALESLTAADGTRIMLSSTAIDSPVTLGGGSHLVLSDITFQALCTSALDYVAPEQLLDTADTWTWEGTHCSGRYDFVRYRLGYVSGSTPVSSPDDLDTLVYTGTAATTSHTAVAGQAYSVFADYASRDQATPTIEGTSDGALVGAFLTT